MLGVRILMRHQGTFWVLWMCFHERWLDTPRMRGNPVALRGNPDHNPDASFFQMPLLELRGRRARRKFAGKMVSSDVNGTRKRASSRPRVATIRPRGHIASTARQYEACGAAPARKIPTQGFDRRFPCSTALRRIAQSHAKKTNSQNSPTKLLFPSFLAHAEPAGTTRS